MRMRKDRPRRRRGSSSTTGGIVLEDGEDSRDNKTSKKEEFFITKLLIDVFIINYREVGGSGGLEVWRSGAGDTYSGPMEEEQEVSRRLVRRLQV